MICEKLLIGKVIFAYSLGGHIVLFMSDSFGIFMMAFLLIILIIAWFVFPALSSGKAGVEQKDG